MSATVSERTSVVRMVLGILTLLVASGWLVVTLSDQSIRLNDFVQYWSAAVVHTGGGNPYDGQELLPHQRAAMGDLDQQQAIMMWIPPWSLALIAPLGLLPAKAAFLIWVVVQLTLVCVSVHWLWKVYGGPPGPGWAFAVGIGFTPTLLLLYFGQVGGLCLFGLAGFLYAHSRGRPVLAGAAAALTALKPHLLLAFGLILALDALATGRGRRALVGGLLAFGCAAGVAWVIHPGVYPMYTAALTAPSSTEVQQHPRDWPLPTFSYWVRMGIAPDQFWVQFVPVVLACGWAAAHWFRRRDNWQWADELPLLVLVSVLAAPYGAWIFDLVLLLVPVVRVAPDLIRRPGVGVPLWVTYGVINLATLGLPLLLPYFHWTGLYYFIVFAPALTVWYFVTRRMTTRVPPPAEK